MASYVYIERKDPVVLNADQKQALANFIVTGNLWDGNVGDVVGLEVIQRLNELE